MNTNGSNSTRADKALADFERIYKETIRNTSGPFIENLEFEILPAMYIISHYISWINNNDDARIFRDNLTHWIYEYLGDDTNYSRYKYRELLFQCAWLNIISLRWEWNFRKKKTEWEKNEIYRIVSLLLDVLVNPFCINEELASDEFYFPEVKEIVSYYNQAPILLHGANEYLKFNFTVKASVEKALRSLASTVFSDLNAEES